MKRVNHKVLEIKTKECLLENGANEFSAESVSKGLVETSLRGVDSHGIRLLPHYINALKNNCNVIFLECRPSNKIARHLYESEGFSEVGIRKDYYPSQNGKEDGIIFAKQIFNK